MARSPHPSEFGQEHLDAVRIGKERFGKMVFENDAEKRDYMRRVNANANNVPGMPSIAMFPPDEIVSHVPDRGSRECRVEGCGGCCVYRDGYVCPRCNTQN